MKMIIETELDKRSNRVNIIVTLVNSDEPYIESFILNAHDGGIYADWEDGGRVLYLSRDYEEVDSVIESLKQLWNETIKPYILEEREKRNKFVPIHIELEV